MSLFNGEIFLDRIDAAPLSDSNFPFQFNQWIANVVDVLNEVITDTQNGFNFLSAPYYTAAEITAMFTAGTIGNGVILYDTTNNEYVGMQSGALVKFTTTAYP
jgi:altronate dehydratase